MIPWMKYRPIAGIFLIVTSLYALFTPGMTLSTQIILTVIGLIGLALFLRRI